MLKYIAPDRKIDTLRELSYEKHCIRQIYFYKIENIRFELNFCYVVRQEKIGVKINKLAVSLIIIGITFLSSAMAENLTPNSGVVFQVIQSQIILSCSTVKSARLITSPSTNIAHPPLKASSTYGVQLKLTPAAAKQFSRITKNGVGKIMNIVVNSKIVSSTTINSSLGGDMILPQSTKMQAEQFIKSLGICTK